MSGEPSKKQSPRFESSEKDWISDRDEPTESTNHQSKSAAHHNGKGKHKKGSKASKGDRMNHEEDADITNDNSSGEKNNFNANPDLDASFFGPQKENISSI